MDHPNNPRLINIDNFDYELPAGRIAQFPLEQRDESRLLICRDGQVTDDKFHNLARWLPEHSLIVFNETRVVHARLIFHKPTGSAIEIFCLEPLAPARDHQQAFEQKGWSEWKCLVGHSKRWKEGPVELSSTHHGVPVRIIAERIRKTDAGTSHVAFRWTPESLSFAEILEITGKLPLPPYINRDPVLRDDETYQTIYARHKGSVAAPTAGLHFTERVMESLAGKNIRSLKFTLHVGAGTFRPVSTTALSGHEMHAEPVYMPMEKLVMLQEALNQPIVLVGTTTVRMLESLFWHGVRIMKGLETGPEMYVGQWDPYDIEGTEHISREESLNTVIRHCKKLGLQSLSGKTRLIITPGYRFRFPDILITNFHQPRSTLLLLIAAFAGEDWEKAYQYALANDFRFLSYGDSCLFFKACQNQ